MQLTLVIPGLVWPAESHRNAARDLALPALASLLGRGTPRWETPQLLEDWLAERFAVQGEERPWAALRLAGEGIDPGDDEWICVDPVHLRFARDVLVLGDAAELGVAADEAAQLVAALNRHFPEVGEFRATEPRRWYLRLAATAQLLTRSPARALGRKVDAQLPEGLDAREWRRLINEAQMLLHAHPVNEAREAAGRPTINSIWPWGSGRLPRRGNATGVLLAADPLARGAAQAAGARAAPLPPRFDPGVEARGELAAVLDELAEPALYQDASTWRAALVRLERDWFAPVLERLYSGRIQQLALVVPGDGPRLTVDIRPQDRWRLWRRPRPLADLQLPVEP